MCSGGRPSTFQVCAPVILQTSRVCRYRQGDPHLVLFMVSERKQGRRDTKGGAFCFFLPRILHSLQRSDILCIPGPRKQLRYPSPEEKKERRPFVAVSNPGGERSSLHIAQRDSKRETISAEPVLSKQGGEYKPRRFFGGAPPPVYHKQNTRPFEAKAAFRWGGKKGGGIPG